MKKLIVLLALFALFAPQVAKAQAITQELLRFTPGRSQTAISDRIVGREIVDYILDAKKGQTISIRFATSNRFAFFNLLAPNDGAALFVGQDVGNPGRFDARLGITGAYKIRVYLMRAEARRGGLSDYNLTVSITGGQSQPLPDDNVGVPEDGGPDFYIVAGLSPGEQLNMRRGPSVTQDVITKLSNGKIVRNLGCRKIGTSRWCQVQNPRVPSQQGWANGRFLRETGATKPDLVVDDNPLPQELPSPSDVENGGPDFYIVAGLSPGEQLNMRRGPSVTQDVITKLSNGKIVRNLGCRKIGTSRWCQVQNPRVPSQQGWANGRFLRETGATKPDVIVEDNPLPQELPSPGDVEDGGPDFYVVAGISQGDMLSMRARPIRSQPLVARLPNGTILQNLGCRIVNGLRWCQVSNPQNSTQRGWVNGRYLRESSPPRAVEDDPLVPATNYNATGQVDCAISGFPRITSCEFGVVRMEQDEATVFISLPDGEKRVLEFKQGRVTPLSATSSFSFRRLGDEYFININNGQERYSIVDALINGG